jgi:hypothetical protein
MKVHRRFLHLPSRQTYIVGRLTSDKEKNVAYALLYRKYIGEVGNPWKLNPENPVGIHVEERLIDGLPCKVLVDKLEHLAILGGIVRESDGKLVGTGRMLCRSRLGGVLEVELYNSFPESCRDEMKRRNCTMELNRTAIESCMRGMRSMPLIPYSLMACEATAEERRGHAFWTARPGYTSRVSANHHNFGRFKYEETDPDFVEIGSAAFSTFRFKAISFALTGGLIPIPTL